MLVSRTAWTRRIVLLGLGLIGLHSLFWIPHEALSGNISDSLRNLAENLPSRLSFTSSTPTLSRANATFVMLAQSTQLEDVAYSIKQIEDRLNKKYRYPWVFLSDQPFTEEFINRTSKITSASASYGVIPKDHWEQPEWINEKKSFEGRGKLMRQGVLNAASIPYRNMCRFNAGFFYRHNLLKEFRYYWRVEPDVRFYCDLDYDPFLTMQYQEKVYGFTMALPELQSTVESLWSTVKDFIRLNPDYVHPDNALGFISDDGGESYNKCHFWSNFEIADMDFWRGDAYSKFFEHLDRAGGFYYERWGDAELHSIAASLFLPKDKLHFFSDVGYKQARIQHCPQGDEHKRGKCWCNDKDSFDYSEWSCLRKFEGLFPTNTTDTDQKGVE